MHFQSVKKRELFTIAAFLASLGSLVMLMLPKPENFTVGNQIFAAAIGFIYLFTQVLLIFKEKVNKATLFLDKRQLTTSLNLGWPMKRVLTPTLASVAYIALMPALFLPGLWFLGVIPLVSITLNFWWVRQSVVTEKQNGGKQYGSGTVKRN